MCKIKCYVVMDIIDRCEYDSVCGEEDGRIDCILGEVWDGGVGLGLARENLMSSIMLALNLECIVWKEVGETCRIVNGGMEVMLGHVVNLRDEWGKVGWFGTNGMAWEDVRKKADCCERRANVRSGEIVSGKLSREWRDVGEAFGRVVGLVREGRSGGGEKVVEAWERGIAKWRGVELMGWWYRVGMARDRARAKTNGLGLEEFNGKRAWERCAELWTLVAREWETPTHIWKKFLIVSCAYFQEKYAYCVQDEIDAIKRLEKTKFFVERIKREVREYKRKSSLWLSLCEAWNSALIDGEIWIKN